MERLRFTYSLDINSQLVQTPGIRNTFFISSGQLTINWMLNIDHKFTNKTPPRSEITAFSLFAYQKELRATPHECSCKFIVKRKNLNGLELFLKGEKKEDECYFGIPKNAAIYKFFEGFFESPCEMTSVLVIELEIPKKTFYARNWPTEVQMAPVGWENDKRYQLLTPRDKHDFHIICTNGVFYTKKRDLKKNSEYFKKKFDSEWKEVHEIKLDISMEAMKVIATYLSTKTFLPPKQLSIATFRELFAVYRKFNLPLRDTHEVFMCYDISEASLSLHELVSWFGSAFYLVKDVIIYILITKYYSEIITHYQPNAVFNDKEKAKTHAILHGKNVACGVTEDESLFRLIIKMFEMYQKVVVDEVSKKQEM